MHVVSPRWFSSDRRSALNAPISPASAAALALLSILERDSDLYAVEAGPALRQESPATPADRDAERRRTRAERNRRRG
jgi:hypothetical protein